MHTLHGVSSLVQEPFSNKDNKTRLAKTSITIVLYSAAEQSGRDDVQCQTRTKVECEPFLTLTTRMGRGWKNDKKG